MISPASTDFKPHSLANRYPLLLRHCDGDPARLRATLYRLDELERQRRLRLRAALADALRCPCGSHGRTT